MEVVPSPTPGQAGREWPFPEDLSSCRTVRMLGRGASGVVELVACLDGRLIAVKRLAGDWGDPAAAARFRREMRIVERLVHPNIVRSAGMMSGETASIMMEFLAGPTLHALLRDRPLSSADALSVMLATCRALGFAHGLGIVHRDVTPGNILFDQWGRPALGDFGIATVVGSENMNSLMTFRTRPGTQLGTPTYMSPEAASGSTEATPSWDIYSAGVLAYRLLVGRPPFASTENPLAVLEAHRTMPPPDPKDVGCPLPHPVTAVLLHALQKRPEDRPATIGEFWTELSGAASSSWADWNPSATIAVTTTRDMPIAVRPIDHAADDEHTATEVTPPLPVTHRVEPTPVALPRMSRRWPGRVAAAVAATVISVLVLVVLVGLPSHTPAAVEVRTLQVIRPPVSQDGAICVGPIDLAVRIATNGGAGPVSYSMRLTPTPYRASGTVDAVSGMTGITVYVAVPGWAARAADPVLTVRASASGSATQETTVLNRSCRTGP